MYIFRHRQLTIMDLEQQLALMQPLHRYIKHTCLCSQKKTDMRSERQTDAAALPGFRGQRSGLWQACFRPACLGFWRAAPASLCDPEVQFCSFSFSMGLSLKLRGETPSPRYLFYVFLSETTNSAAAAAAAVTTGRYIHICYSDLGHYHFIVWHTICIKLQFSALKGLPWLKTVSDVQKGIFFSH